MSSHLFEIGWYAVWGLFWFFVLSAAGVVHDWATAAAMWLTYTGGLLLTRLVLGNPFTARRKDDDDDLF